MPHDGGKTGRTGEVVVLDNERGRTSDRVEIRIWLRLLSCTTQIENILKSRLRQEFGISLARFDILAQLERFPRGLTMSELSWHLMVSNGAITALVDKLAAEKLITRKEHPEDKRTMVVRLTDSGRGIFLKMAKRHEEWVISLLGDLSGGAQSDLLRSLVLLKKRLGDGVIPHGERSRVQARR